MYFLINHNFVCVAFCFVDSRYREINYNMLEKIKCEVYTFDNDDNAVI